MNTLQTTLQELESTLLQIRKQCSAIPVELQELQYNFTTYPPMLLHLRLQFLCLQVMTLALSLYINHDGKGLVVLMNTGIGLVAHWTDNEKIVADAEWFEKRGTLILTIDEFTTEIRELEEQLKIGNLTEVVKQINNLNFVGASE